MPQPDKDQMIQEMLSSMNAAVEMPKYKCHKVVWALKIENIKKVNTFDGIGSEIIPENKKYAPIHVTVDYMTKHQPQIGGYYVVYEDGYKSFSPAKAFEDGYTLC